MVGVPGPNSWYPQSPPPPPIWPLASEDLAVFTLGGLFSGTQNLFKITSQRLLDQSQAGPSMWKNATFPSPPILGLFGPIRAPYPKGFNCWFNPL